MLDYKNKNCEQCGEPFKENDDIAVCPDCGTPVHRSCWTGHCPNEERHGNGFEWTDKGNNNENNISVTDKSRCGICGEMLSGNAVFCPDCKTGMHLKCYMENGGCPNAENHDKMRTEDDSDDYFNSEPRIFIDTFESFAEKITKRPITNRETGEALTCHGVTQAELLHFLGKYNLSTPRYIGLFLRMANTGKKAAFNFWAGFLMPYYQFYQKMIGPGVLLLLATFILEIPQLMAYYEYLSSGKPIEQFAAASGFSGLMDILAVISFVLQILLAVFSDYIYMHWTVNKIKHIREAYRNAPEAEYYEALAKKGNPKWFFVFIGFGISVVIYYIFSFLFLV